MLPQDPDNRMQRLYSACKPEWSGGPIPSKLGIHRGIRSRALGEMRKSRRQKSGPASVFLSFKKLLSFQTVVLRTSKLNVEEPFVVPKESCPRIVDSWELPTQFLLHPNPLPTGIPMPKSGKISLSIDEMSGDDGGWRNIR